MHPKNFVICDAEQEYAENLLHAISLRKELGLQMHLFQNLEQLETFSRKKAIHILLLGEDFPVEKREEIRAKERYVLVKGEAGALLADEKAVFKYQSSDQILSCVLEEGPYGEGGFCKDRSAGAGKLIGIYSPVHRIGKTKFAIELGKDLAKTGPVLYLNLEEYSGGDYYFQESSGQNLSDILYYVRQEKGNLGFRISAMAGRIGEMDYVSPIPVIQDLRMVEEAEWLKLFETIFSQTMYKSVILDLGDGVNGLYRILRECQTVYTLYGDDFISQAKLKQYSENLRQTGFEDVLEHTVQRKVRLKVGEEL